MGEIFFIIKAMLITAIVILALQIRIGPATLEQRSLKWMRQSVAMEALRGVAESSVIAIETGYAWSRKMIEKQFKQSKDFSAKRKDWESEAQKYSGADVD